MSFSAKLFRVFIFLLPTQLSLHFWPEFAFVWGIRVDYLAPVIYLTDILSLAIFIAWFFEGKAFLKLQKYFKYFLLICMFAAINISISTIPLFSLFKWLKVLEFLALFVYVRENNIWRKIATPLALSIVFAFFLATAQIVKSGSLGGIFYWLGERNFTLSTPGIALFSFFGNEALRPYGTFSHPNALAGFSLVCFFMLFSNKKKLAKAGAVFAFLLSVISISQNAWAAAITAPIFTRLKHIKIKPEYVVYFFVVFSLILAIAGSRLTSFGLPEFISERLLLNDAAGRLFSEAIWTGRGLGVFVAILPEVLTLRTLQPVHNIFLLVSTETGLVGLFLFAFFVAKNINAMNFILVLVILITGLFDHYWLTQQQTFLLLAVVLGLRESTTLRDKMANDNFL